MKQLDIYQALWGMEDIPNKEKPYDIDTKLNMVKEAGFDGVLNYIDDQMPGNLEIAYGISDKIKALGLKLGLSCHGHNIKDVKRKIDYTKKAKGDYLNIMMDNYYIRGEEAIELLGETILYGKSQGVKVYIETHRGTVTQDLLRTVDYLEVLDDMYLTIDLSHYVVGGEIDIVSENVESNFAKLIDRAQSLHVRVSNGEQVQLSLQRIDEELLSQYKGWWKRAITNRLKYLDESEKFPVVVELGPENYHQKVWSGEKWLYDGDRWEDAKEWMGIFRGM